MRACLARCDTMSTCRRSSSSPRVSAPLVDAAVEVLGSSARLELLRFIAEHPDSHYGRIQEGVPGIGQTALARHLRALEQAGVLHVDIPPEERKGRSPRYRVLPTRLDELTAAWVTYVTGGATQ